MMFRWHFLFDGTFFSIAHIMDQSPLFVDVREVEITVVRVDRMLSGEAHKSYCLLHGMHQITSILLA